MFLSFLHLLAAFFEILAGFFRILATFLKILAEILNLLANVIIPHKVLQNCFHDHANLFANETVESKKLTYHKIHCIFISNSR